MNSFIIIVEGQDRTGKDTIVKSIIRKYFDKTIIPIHCIGPGSESKNPLEESKKFYKDLLFHISLSNPNVNFILNRSHIGEMVYSPLYRGYNGDYVLELEKKFITSSKICGCGKSKKTLLIVLVDSSNQNMERDDNDSLANNKKQSNEELSLFKEAFNKSSISQKVFIDIKNKNISEVKEEVLNFLKGHL